MIYMGSDRYYLNCYGQHQARHSKRKNCCLLASVIVNLFHLLHHRHQNQFEASVSVGSIDHLSLPSFKDFQLATAKLLPCPLICPFVVYLL